MRIKVLGPIEVSGSRGEIRLSGQRQRALLAALSLEFGRAVPIQRLIDVLWDAAPPATAQGKVHAHVSALRQVIGDTPGGPLRTSRAGYLLQPEGTELDLADFDALCEQGREAANSGHQVVATRLFASALDLWRGPAFADVTSRAIRSAAEALDGRRLLTLEAKAEADLSLERCDVVVRELSDEIREHPFRERLRGLLMLALYRHGCRADALGLYRDGRRQMVAELGLEPGPQLRGLHQRILTDDAALARRSA